MLCELGHYTKEKLLRECLKKAGYDGRHILADIIRREDYRGEEGSNVLKNCRLSMVEEEEMLFQLAMQQRALERSEAQQCNWWEQADLLN